MAKFFTEFDRFARRLAAFRRKIVERVAQVVRKIEQVLKLLRQRGQVFQPVTAHAELPDAESLRLITDGVRPVTFGAIEPGYSLLFRKMLAGFELRELRLVTGAAHRQRPVSIRLADEVCRMSFRLVRLRGIATVTIAATDAHFTVRACLVDSDDFQSAAC